MKPVVKAAHVMRRFTFDKWGGTETVVFNISRQLVKRGIDSPIFCTDMFSRSGAEDVDGVLIRRFPYVFPWIGLGAEARDRLRLKGGSPLALRLFFRLLFEPNLSLIHVHVQHRLGGIARTVAKLRRIPYVASIHGGYYTIPEDQNRQMVDPFRGKPEWGKVFGFLWGARRTLQDASAIICVGRNEYDEVAGRYPEKVVRYIPNGVEVSKFTRAEAAPFREHIGLGAGEKYVLCLSRIDYQKNQLLLVKAFARFHAAHPEYKLVLIGPVTVEDYHRRILDEIEASGLAKSVIVIPGLKPGDPLLQSAYKGADFFILPTSHEPFGIVVLEAWAAGIPVIASRVGGIPGFTSDGENILLFNDKDEDGLLERMERLASNPELARRIAAAGQRQASENYDWSKIAERVLRIYEEIRGGERLAARAPS